MNEDFVTSKIAHKLKEKGFNQKCLAYYDVEDNVGLLYNTQYTDEAIPCQYTDLLQCHNTGEAESQIDDSGFCVDAPTISQVLKWLREEKIISVEPCATPYNCWYYMIKCNGEIKATYTNNKYKTYEAAASAGIEYTLDNLI